MMDVNCVVSMPGTEICTEYLHVPASMQCQINTYIPNLRYFDQQMDDGMPHRNKLVSTNVAHVT